MVNTFSFCLYGPYNPRYYDPLLKTISNIHKYYPDWHIYIWCGPDVDAGYLAHLRTLANVVIRETGILGERNMIQRFFTIDEPGVDIMMVRDADSILNWRDRWAINEFLASSFQAHTIRDHRDHSASLMGGLWGIRKSAGLSIRNLYAGYTEDVSRGHRLAHDQNFLGDVVYPLVRDRLLVHYSNRMGRPGEHAVEFPFLWSEDSFCGRIDAVPKSALHFLPFR